MTSSIVGPVARSITMSEPDTSKTSGTGTPYARACVMTWASQLDGAGVPPVPVAPQHPPAADVVDVRVPSGPDKRPRHFGLHAPSLPSPAQST